MSLVNTMNSKILNRRKELVHRSDNLTVSLGEHRHTTPRCGGVKDYIPHSANLQCNE